jgi:hypothetical protein
MAIKLEIKGLDATIKRVGKLADEIKRDVGDELYYFGKRVEAQAKATLQRNGTSNTGALAGSINAVRVSELEVSVTVAKNYAAFIEFGTRKYAAAYVSTLPPDWATYAATFKGKTGGSFEEMIDSLMQWVHDRGLDSNTAKTGTFSVKTKKRTGNFLRQAIEDRQTAYAIAIWILRNGIRPQPYLYPAVRDNVKLLRDNVQKLINA